MALAVSSITVAIFDAKQSFHLQLVPHISRDHQYWRFFGHHVAFSNSSELFLWELILYSIGVSIERQFGCVKYASFLVVSTPLVTALELLSLLAAPSPSVYYTSIPFSCLLHITFRVFGVTLSNKIFIYTLALLLAFSQPWSTTLAAVLGLTAGALYRSDIANLKGYRLPPWFVRLSSRYLLSLVGESRAVRRTNRALPVTDLSETTPPRLEDEVVTTAAPRGERAARFATGSRDAAEQPGPSVMREWVNELTGRVDRASTGIRVPTEDEISQLMGIFPDLQRDVIVAALQRRWVRFRFLEFLGMTIGAVPNIESAAGTLLSASS
ncbi:hypothetical protein EDB89DRAFT_2062633 [Lactarius sanguifluus]|nr:hypothetical protein EDB89DRAFT_2062633 [Lactarius sanguifluus]